MRGLSFHNSIIILDEAQNTTPEQQYLVASRVGKGSKIIICGDYKRQMDIKGFSGLADLLEVIGHMPEVGITEFTPKDIVRSGLAKKIITAYYERR
jgi:phosphate starvation-inducible PhoH-like protein